MIDPELLVATCNSTGQVFSRNRSWIRVLGDDNDLWSRLVETDREIARQNLTEAARGALVSHALFMVVRSMRDEPLPVLLHFIPVKSAHTWHVAISGEVLAEPETWTESQTERHRMETLGRMTMGMAHDFNNLLSGILGHLALWRAEDPEGASRAAAHIETMERAATDGAELIQKVQRYIRQESRSGFAPIDLSGLLKECIAFTRPYWFNEPRRSGIEIIFNHDLPTLPSILGSAAELRDVMVNLILNAVHAMPEGGTLHLSAASEEGRVRVDLQDTGSGMSPEVADRIFEPLFSTKGEKGTGMGLAVAAGIVREHDGEIQVTSEPGVGSTFTLLLPLPDMQQPDTDLHPPALSVPTAPDIQCNVLVVDDEAMVRNVVTRLLELRGHQVWAASSGAEGMDVLEHHPMDLVITDQGMPRMSGRELAHHIAIRYPDLPVVLLTGDTDLNVNRAEIARVLTKPFKIDDLTKAISDLVPHTTS